MTDNKRLEDILKKFDAKWHGTYLLNEDKTIISCTFSEWSDQIEKMHETHTQHVCRTTINGKWISTVWIGLDYGSIFKNLIPLLFETMIFDDEKDEFMDYQCRYPTWNEAEKGHEEAIKWVANGCMSEDEK